MNLSIRTQTVSGSGQNIPASIAAACALLLGFALQATAHAQTVINFDSVDASGGGVDATGYLSGFGITLVNVSHPGTVDIFDDQVSNFQSASSGTNFLLQQVGGAPAESFTMDFATPLTSLSFTRIENVTNNLVAAWTATAFAGSTPLTSYSESLGLGPFTPHTYVFSGPGITSLTISANGANVAGITSAAIDDLTLTPAAVPEPSIYAMLLGAMSLGFATFRRKKMVT